VLFLNSKPSAQERIIFQLQLRTRDLSARKGYASAAWKLMIEYYYSNGIEDIYTQTWSGNERGLGLMTKFGFEKCHRNVYSREVRGNLFDGLTLRLNKNRYL